eukprot:g10729.t1
MSSTNETPASLKEEGTKSLLAKDYDTAIDKYSDALDMQPTGILRLQILSNRSHAYNLSGDYTNGMCDANKLIDLDPKYKRSYLRLAQSLFGNGELNSAIKACDDGLKELPNNNDLLKFRSRISGNGNTRWWFAKTLSTKHPSIHVMLSKIITPLFKMMLSLPNESITLDQMANTIQPFIAQIELMVGLFLIFELFTPYRNIIILFVFWNWMKMRYQLNSYTQDAFRKFDRTISPYALKIPIISNVYVVVKNFMIKQSAMPQPGNQGGGLMGGVSNMMRSCSVM